MKNINFLQWNLSFKDREYERLFLDSKGKFQSKAVGLVIIAITIISLTGWITNPFRIPPYESYSLSFLIALIAAKICYHLVPCRYRGPSLREILGIFLILFFLIGTLENIRRSREESDQEKEHSFSFGIVLEFVLTAMILARIGWMKVATSFFIMTALIIFVYSSFEENFKSEFYPLAIQIENLIFLAVLAFFLEKKERERFFEMQAYENSLSSFKTLITDFIPIPIVIFNKNGMTFHNKEAEILLETANGVEICERLGTMRVFANNQSQENTKDKNNEDLHFNEVNPNSIDDQGLPLMSVIWKSFEMLENKWRVSMANQAVLLSKENGSKRFFDIKFKDIFWEGNLSIMAIIEENITMKRVNYLEEQAEYKNKLLATVSHDLRTPLYGIMGMISVAKEMITDLLVIKK